MGGPTNGGTDLTGKPTGKTPASVQPAIYNVAVTVDGHGNPFFTDADAQVLHDTTLSVVQSTVLPAIPIKDITPLSLKVLTGGVGVLDSQAPQAPGFNWMGAVVVLYPFAQ